MNSITDFLIAWGVWISVFMLASSWLLTNRPILDLWIDLGFLQVSTELLNDSLATGTHTHVGFRLTLFRRWGFRFRLYRVYRRGKLQ